MGVKVSFSINLDNNKTYVNKHKRIYDSYEMYDFDGTFLCYCSKGKAKFYLHKNNFANWMDEDGNLLDKKSVDHNSTFPNGFAFYNGKQLHKFKLNFQSNKGKTASSITVRNDPYYLQKLKNICVCCGTTENLTKHHVVPYMYRKHLHNRFKNNNHHDVLPVCYECHRLYELTANDYKAELLYKYNIPVDINIIKTQTEIKNERILKARNVILTALSNEDVAIPIERLTELLKISVMKPIVLNPHTDDMFEKYMRPQKTVGESVIKHVAKLSSTIHMFRKNNISVRKKRKNESFQEYMDYLETHGYKEIFDKIEDNLYCFIFSWRQHFIENANPKYMPKFWDVKRKY